jgi:hypothetical protein
VLTINSEMRVGGIQETITVTGESPVVDTQTSTRRQMVLSNDTIQAIPASRGYGNLLATVPGFRRPALTSAPASPPTSSPRAADVAMKARFRSMA